MKNTPYNYYAHPASQPVLCEITEDGWVYFICEDREYRRERYGGRFVRLVEAADTDETTPIATDEKTC